MGVDVADGVLVAVGVMVRVDAFVGVFVVVGGASVSISGRPVSVATDANFVGVPVTEVALGKMLENVPAK